MAITYDTNWMGPITIDWYRDRGLITHVWRKVETEEVANLRRLDIGDSYMIEEVTTYYSAGRIDIRDDSKQGYDGWDEYSVAPMHAEDWTALSDYLLDLESDTLIPYDTLIDQFETDYGKSIRWWKDDQTV